MILAQFDVTIENSDERLVRKDDKNNGPAL